MGIKRQERTVNSERHVSPQVLSTDCCGESFNDAVTLPSCSVASPGGEDYKTIQERLFWFGLESTQLACRHHFLQKNHGMTVGSDLIPPPQYPSRGLLRQLVNGIWGGLPCNLTWPLRSLDKWRLSPLQITWQVKVVTCQVIWRSAGG